MLTALAANAAFSISVRFLLCNSVYTYIVLLVHDVECFKRIFSAVHAVMEKSSDRLVNDIVTVSGHFGLVEMIDGTTCRRLAGNFVCSLAHKCGWPEWLWGLVILPPLKARGESGCLRSETEILPALTSPSTDSLSSGSWLLSKWGRRIPRCTSITPSPKLQKIYTSAPTQPYQTDSQRRHRTAVYFELAHFCKVGEGNSWKWKTNIQKKIDGNKKMEGVL